MRAEINNYDAPIINICEDRIDQLAKVLSRYLVLRISIAKSFYHAAVGMIFPELRDLFLLSYTFIFPTLV